VRVGGMRARSRPDHKRANVRGPRTVRDARLRLAELVASKSRAEYVDPADSRATIRDLGTEWLRIGEHAVGLVEAYSIKSAEAAHLWRLVNLRPESGPRARNYVPRKIRRLNDDELVTFKAAYLSGTSVLALASEYGLHRTTVIATAKRLGLTRSNKALQDDEIASAAELYLTGENLAMVARRFDVGTETMRTALVLHGVAIRSRGRQRSL